ncbi:MAG TPA: type I methionyl aminopeptidase [Thermoanaerobaculia bacterium]|nr:type I methionyl aminopeptidase [Thermoanaerobaculia bacterium]
MITLRGHEELKRMDRACAIVHSAIDAVAEAIAPGVTTDELDRIAEKVIRGAGARPAFLGYRGYPKTLCVSVNDEVVHGIPGKRKLAAGDIVGIDCGAVVEGYFGDAARSFPVGKVRPEAAKLIQDTREALARGIAAALPGRRISDIGAAVEEFAAPHGYGIVREFVGHGVGTALHEEPQVPNYGPGGRGPVLKEGMVIAIEPMLNLGTSRVSVQRDGWTVKTQDGKWSAHFEDTIAIGADGPVVLGVGDFERVRTAVPA